MAVMWMWATSVACMNPMGMTTAVGAAAIASGPLEAVTVVVDGGEAAIQAALGVERRPYPAVPMAAAAGLTAGAGTTDLKVAYSATIPQDECLSPEFTGLRTFR